MKKLFLSILLLLTLSACSEVEYNITLNPGNDLITQNETWVDNGCAITINEEDYDMELSTTLDNTEVGEQTLVYNYTFKEVTYTCKRVVKVQATPNFNIALNPGLDTVSLNTVHKDKGLVFLDDNESDFIVTTTSDVDTTTRGTYTITYTILSRDGIQLVLYRIVNVIS